MKLQKIKTKKIKEFIKKLLFILGEKAFLTFLGLLLIAFIFGFIIYHQYNVSIKKVDVQIFSEPFEFQEKIYRKILNILQEKEKKFQETEFKEYPDPFRID